ncbi:uncharacterized protein BJ212DRAFT_1448905 [Suillus subaureus]|uniref:Uncharacterized protein n=1 Tax=Suillus subaureus TaxID=48587 RepID=A0A9P7J925_9AGAM|nr:uncharacterized protein BJ212DRAFT_1448905 [Suillus subaureus]KAG1808960.1 hypothetical protein BJ212DRAFT_1448905 [Suillus subaureus]
MSPPQPFEEDDIRVEYHPSSQHPMQVHHFEEYGRGPGAPTAVLPVVVPFQGNDQTFQLFHHSIWDWAVDLLQDPQVGPQFPWTANAFWEYQSKIPSDAKPLTFILYADKAKLLLFGQAKGYPVVAQCTNLPVAIHNGDGLGGGQVVGWLPIDKKHSRKLAFVNFKNAVWHQSVLKMLTCLAPLSKIGSAVKCWDDLVCIFYPIILILSADYEEQSVMALIQGLMGKFPCPICLIPCDELFKTSNVYPLCISADSATLEAREQILSSESLHDVDNSFDIMEHTDVHQALSYDKLHFNDGGLFSDHQWTKLQNFDLFPQWRNLNHFSQVTSISFSDGTKYEDILKLIVFAAHNVFDHDQDLEAYLLLHCVHSYMEFNMYASFEVHTEDTINDGRKALANLTELMDKYIQDTLDLSDKSWNLPKKHLSAHLFNDIEAKGVTQNYSTKPNKKMHDPLKDAYQDCTNFKNFAEQSDLPDPEANEIEQIDGLHFSLGSQQATQSFADVEAINYESLVDCPMFHGSPRYDFIILQTEARVIFAQLLLVFTCMVGDVQYPIMLTLLYDQPAKPRVSTEFFSVQSIICGCVLVEDSSRPNKALVIDTLDTDMFLCMKEIHTDTAAG